METVSGFAAFGDRMFCVCVTLSYWHPHVCVVVVTWYTWVYTSDLKGAGTDSNVFLVAYGEKGKSDDIPLKNKTDNFEAGMMDAFKFEMTDIGKPYKIRVWHDDKGLASGWHLNKVRFEGLVIRNVIIGTMTRD